MIGYISNGIGKLEKNLEYYRISLDCDDLIGIFNYYGNIVVLDHRPS